MLYKESPTSLIRIGVPTSNPCGPCVVTVILLVGVAPSPDIIDVITRGSAANAPTISNSGLTEVNPSLFPGNISVELTVLPDPVPYAFDGSFYFFSTSVHLLQGRPMIGQYYA